MNINIKATNIELTEQINKYVEKRISYLEKILDESGDRTVQVAVDIGKETNRHIHGDIFFAKVRVEQSGEFYYAEAEKEDLMSAIDAAEKSLRREITGRTGKKRDKKLRGRFQIKSFVKKFLR